MTSADAYKALLATMKKYSNFGAQDSEGFHALERLEYAVEHCERFPLNAGPWPYDNPWELYESVDGWGIASVELIEAAREYWKAKMGERLGVTIGD